MERPRGRPARSRDHDRERAAARTASSAASATSSCATAGGRTRPGSSSPAGPYFAKHDHLDAAHLVVYHKGYLAIDAGADYTDTESPHYLNHYRRTIAHNTVLVYQPGESFFWSENRWPAANDGGQRMDSSRFWNSVRSLEDWRRTRDLWDRCTLSPVAAEPSYRYARADATRAYQPSKLESFTREIVHLRETNALVVLDRVRATDPSYRKAWLLHGVSEPKVVAPAHRRERRARRDDLPRRVAS